MKAVLLEILTYCYLSSILVAAVAAIRYRKDLASRGLAILVPYLLLVLVQEVVLTITRNYGFTNNAIVYNLYRPINVLVFAYLYYQLPFMKQARKLIIGTTILYLLITVVDYAFFESINDTSMFLILTRGFIITFFAVVFLFHYFFLDDPAGEKYWNPYIWITVGILIFYPVISLSLSLQKFLVPVTESNSGIRLYNFIPQLMSIFMYSCFCYAFYLCQRKKLTSSPRSSP